MPQSSQSNNETMLFNEKIGNALSLYLYLSGQERPLNDASKLL